MPGEGIEKRKWWHTSLRLLDQQGLQQAILNTASGLPDDNAENVISARVIADCQLADIPVPAWDNTISPGYFIYRPSKDQILNSVVEVDSYEKVMDIQNRHVFEYQLRIAYDSTDVSCTTLGPPDTHDLSPFPILEDHEQGTVFEFPELPFFDTVGCCDIEVGNPGSPIEPGSMAECSRIWWIEQIDAVNHHLYTYDISAAVGMEKVDRGEIDAATGSINFHDIAWDDRNVLWGLEDNGLRRIVPGDSVTNSVALDYSVVTDNAFGGSALDTLFPIVACGPGTPGMSYNQHNERLYISANDHFFELIKVNANEWEIINLVPLGNSVELGDIAFSPTSEAFCVYNNSLATVNFEGAFGQLRYVVEDGLYEDVNSLDFILTLGGQSMVTLYGITKQGRLFSANTIDASQTDIANLTSNEVKGASSCQAGEDLSIPIFPFYTGASPWIFFIDNSQSMINNNRLQTIKEKMNTFLDNNVVSGDRMTIILYGDGFSQSPNFVFLTDGDIDAAKEWLDENFDASGNATQFCEPEGPFTSTLFQNYSNLLNVIVIGDGNFTNCPAGNNETSDLGVYLQQVINDAKIANGNDLTFTAVGIFPDAGTSNLQLLGTLGGGGYTSWT